MVLVWGKKKDSILIYHKISNTSPPRICSFKAEDRSKEELDVFGPTGSWGKVSKPDLTPVSFLGVSKAQQGVKCTEQLLSAGLLLL